MKTTDTTPTSSGDSPQQTDAGVSRRQLVRAGLSAAPVVAVLKSNTVLAGTVGGGVGNAVAPSAFASLQANQGRVSQSTSKADYRVTTPAQWLSSLSPELKTKKFKDCGFNATLGGKYKANVTLAEVLKDTDNSIVAKLARYVLASYLTAQQFGDNRDVLALTTLQCKAIWKGQGVWKPFAGARWDYVQTIAYFETIYGMRGSF